MRTRLAVLVLVWSTAFAGIAVVGFAPVAHAALANGAYHPVTPARILDTRAGIGAPTGPVGQNTFVNLQVTGVGGVPSTGVVAVVMNVTAVDPTDNGGFLTVWPSDEGQPNVSNLNFDANQNVPNLITVKVGATGAVSIYNRFGNTQVLADVVGWYDNGSVQGGYFNPLPPARIVDTRSGIGAPMAPVAQNGQLDFQATGTGGVPSANVSAVVLNVTVTDTTSAGFLTVWPQGAATRPNVSNLNFTAGQTVANLVTVGVNATSGRVSVFNAFGNSQVIVDVVGWYDANGTQGSVFRAVSPLRIADTRPVHAPLVAGQPATINVLGQAGVPTTGVTGAVANVTAVGGTSDGFFTIYPTGTAPPNASSVNWKAGTVVPNLVVTAVSSKGEFDVLSPFGSVDLLIDVYGYFTAPV